MVKRDPLVANLFENMIVIEALKARLNAGNAPDMYFFRDQRGFEIDMLLAVERKQTICHWNGILSPGGNKCFPGKKVFYDFCGGSTVE